MLSLYIVSVVSMLFLIIVIIKVIKRVDNIEEMKVDILIMISSAFGIIGIFNLYLSKDLKINFDFFMDSIFFIIVSLIFIIATYIVYFKDKGKGRYIWFFSEILMAWGLNIILLGIVYIYQGIGYLPEDILKENFPIFFENKNDPISKEQLFNLKTSGLLFIIIIGMLSIVFALLLNSYRQRNLLKAKEK